MHEKQTKYETEKLTMTVAWLSMSHQLNIAFLDSFYFLCSGYFTNTLFINNIKSNLENKTLISFQLSNENVQILKYQF